MSSTATISFDNPQQQGFNLGLYDLQGHEVRSYSVTNGERFTVDKGDLQAGVYIFKLSGPTSYYGRLVIQ